MNLKYTFYILPALLLLGCNSDSEELQLKDLTNNEHIAISRYITLERARAVALSDSISGIALLDSIQVAWGDSSLQQTSALLPDDPTRLAALHKLLVKMLDSESDSLLIAPTPERLTHPLPNPEPKPNNQ